MSTETTAAAASGNTDAPTATVPVGVSEYVAYVIGLSAILNGTLGHDYGLAANAQAISILVGGVVLAAQGIARAIKHHAAMHANAAVYAAQLAQVMQAIQSGGQPHALAAGVNALNTAIATDTSQQATSPS